MPRNRENATENSTITGTVDTRTVGGQLSQVQITVTSSAQALSSLLTAASGSVLTNRSAVLLYNKGGVTVYLSTASGVTASNGHPIDPTITPPTLELPLSDANDVYLITASTSCTMSVLQTT